MLAPGPAGLASPVAAASLPRGPEAAAGADAREGKEDRLGEAGAEALTRDARHAAPELRKDILSRCVDVDTVDRFISAGFDVTLTVVYEPCGQSNKHSSLEF